MFKKILVPLDGSELAEGAIMQAKKLATRFEAELHFLRIYAREQPIVDPHGGYVSYHTAVTSEEAKQRAVAYLEKVQSTHADPKLDLLINTVESYVKVGEAIANFAAANDIGLIVMTSHGYTGFRRLIMGSVTTETLQYAQCPVMVVPSTEEN